MENQTSSPVVLPSGLTLLVVERPNSKAFAASLTLPVGENDAPYEHPQLAHLVEHLAFLGRNRQLVELLNGQGGVVNGRTAVNYTQFYACAHIELVEPSLQFLLGVLGSEAIDPEDLAREQRVLDKEYIQYGPGKLRHCDSLATQQTRRLRGANKLLLPISQYQRSLYGVSEAQVNDFQASHYCHEVARLVVVSSLSSGEIIELLPPSTREAAQPRSAPHRMHDRPTAIERNQFVWNRNRSSRISVKHVSDDSSPIRSLAGALLEDHLENGQHSPFFRYLRQQLGLTYSVNVDFSRLIDRSLFEVSLAIDKRDVPSCLLWIIEQLDHLADEGWMEETYERLRQRFYRKQDLWFEGASQIATYLGYELLREESQQMLSPKDYRSLAEGATLETVNQELRNLLATQNRYTTVVGPMGMLGRWRLRRELATEG